MAVPTRILITAVLGFYGTGLCFGLLSSVVDDLADSNAAWAAPRSAVEAAGVMASLGLTCLIIVSSLLVMRSVLGGSGTVAASLAALVGISYCINESFPLSEYLLYYWTWRVAALWCMALGAGLGVALAGRRRGGRFLWMPLAEMLLSLATLRIVFEPLLTEVVK